MATILAQSSSSKLGETLIVADKLKINTEEDLKICKHHNHQSGATIPPDDLQKMKEELIHIKACLNESQSNFKNQKKEIEELIGVFNQNKIASNTTHLSVPIYPSSISSSTSNSNNLKLSANNSTNLSSINQKSKPEISTSLNTRVLPPKNNDQTQKMSSRNDRSLNPSPKVRNERSARAIDRNIIPTSGNALDIWIRSSPLFQPLPSLEEIDDICRAIDTDKLVFNTQNKQHWSDRLGDIVRNSQKDTKKTKNQISMPPGRPPAPNDIADYWTKQTPPFQIEEMQKQNKSIMHCLLSAFVEAKPLPKSQEEEEPDNLLNADFLPIHVLLPQLEFDDYMSHPFEERLELELKSAGLEKPSEEVNTVNNAFAKEIEEYKREIKELQPKIDELRNEIVKKLPEYRLDEDRRMTEAQEYTELLRECRKDHKKA